MVQMNKENEFYKPTPILFNSPLETGMRALVILNAAYPKAFDLLQLTWFDHLVVHTGDIGGPKSLHPDVPYRSGELLIRRHLIEESLILMTQLHLINIITNEQGITYQASDEAYSFLELIHSEYISNLRERADWLVENISTLSLVELQTLITDKIARWDIEFQSASMSEVRARD